MLNTIKIDGEDLGLGALEPFLDAVFQTKSIMDRTFRKDSLIGRWPDKIEGEQLNGRGGKEQVDPKDLGWAKGFAVVSARLITGKTSSSKSLRTWTSTSVDSTFTQVNTGIWTMEVEARGVRSTVAVDI